MPITVKTAAALLAIFLALFAGAGIILANAVRPGFERLETEAHARDRARVEAYLQSRARDIQARAVDYAHWDDTYAFFGGGQPSFLMDNFPDQWFANYGIDLLAFADERGRILWTRGRQEDGTLTSNSDAAQSILENALAAPNAQAGAATGTVWTLDGPYLFAAERATRTNGTGAPRGYVILGKRLSRQSLRGQVQLDLALVPAAAPPPDLASHFSALASGPQTWVLDNTARSLIPLQDASGKLIGAVLAERPRDLAVLGARSVDLALALFALMTALVLAGLWFLLRHLVISRVVRLEKHLHAQSGADHLAPLVTPPSRDEIGRLTQAYNSLVERLRDSNVREHRAVAEREAEASSNRMKSDFLANISHQLRTPLDSVIGYAELIEEEIADGSFDDAASDLNKVRVSARHLLSLVNEILDLSKIEAGRFEIALQSFMVEEMITAATSAARPLARESGAKLSIQIPKDLGLAFSDEQRLRQCLVNMLAHACGVAKHGAVSLSAARVLVQGQDLLRFDVRDDAPAMSAAEAARMFETFPVEGDSHRKQAGALGLAVTAKIARLIGGSMEFHSVEGEGSTCTLTVPAHLDQPPVASAA